MSDALGAGILIWNNKFMTRFRSDTFLPKPSRNNFTVAQSSRIINGGIATIALSPKTYNGERFLFYRPLASRDLNFVSTEALDNSIRTGRSIKPMQNIDVLSSQAVGQVFSSSGILFLGLTKDLAIACYNMFKPLTKQNIVSYALKFSSHKNYNFKQFFLKEVVVQDYYRLQFVGGLKIIDFSGEEELWILTNRFTAFRTGNISFHDFNYFVLKIAVSKLIQGTGCQFN